MSHGPKVVRKVWSEWVCEDRAVVLGIEISSFPRVQQESCDAHVQISKIDTFFLFQQLIYPIVIKEKRKITVLRTPHLFCKFEISRFVWVFSQVIWLPSFEMNLDASTVDFSGGPVVPEGILVNLLPWRLSLDFLLTFRSDETTISSNVCPKTAKCTRKKKKKIEKIGISWKKNKSTRLSNKISRIESRRLSNCTWRYDSAQYRFTFLKTSRNLIVDDKQLRLHDAIPVYKYIND